MGCKLNNLISSAILVCLLFVIGCEDSKQAKLDFNYMKEAKIKIEVLHPNTPSEWSADEKLLLERYFKIFAYWVQYGEKNEKNAKKKFFLPENTTCADILVRISKWKDLSRNCQLDEFYICPEEMRKYEKLVDRAESLIAGCEAQF